MDIALNEIKELSGCEKVEYEPLNGGLSNITYKVKAGNSLYVLRVNGNQNDYLNLRRAEEQAVIKTLLTIHSNIK